MPQVNARHLASKYNSHTWSPQRAHGGVGKTQSAGMYCIPKMHRESYCDSVAYPTQGLPWCVHINICQISVAPPWLKLCWPHLYLYVCMHSHIFQMSTSLSDCLSARYGMSPCPRRRGHDGLKTMRVPRAQIKQHFPPIVAAQQRWCSCCKPDTERLVRDGLVFVLCTALCLSILRATQCRLFLPPWRVCLHLSATNRSIDRWQSVALRCAGLTRWFVGLSCWTRLHDRQQTDRLWGEVMDAVAREELWRGNHERSACSCDV